MHKDVSVAFADLLAGKPEILADPTGRKWAACAPLPDRTMSYRAFSAVALSSVPISD